MRPPWPGTAAAPARRRLLVALGVLLIGLFAAVEVLLLQSYGDSARTTRDFRRATDAATAIANTQRESFLLDKAVSRLKAGDRLAPVVLRRALLARQVDVVAHAAPANRGLMLRVGAIRRHLARFDRAFAASYGSGDRARKPGRGRHGVRRALERLELDVKYTFDEEEHRLYAALGEALDERARGQLLIVGLSVFALLGAAGFALVVHRAIRGDFARAYRMLDRSEARLHGLVAQLPAVVYALALDDDGHPIAPTFVSPQVEEIAGVGVDEALHDAGRLLERVHADDRQQVQDAIAHVVGGGTPEPLEFRFLRPNGEEIWLRDSGATVMSGPNGRQLQGLLFDITAAKRAEAERDQMELDLRLAQKLEAVGQLAAGIAHEINTPIQFVGDTVRFVEDAFDDLMDLQAAEDELHRANAAGHVPPELVERVRRSKEDADLDYLRERLPAAFERAGEGIRRVASIVGAMRDFARPPTSEQQPVDLNQALRNTLIVAANEYKYVADVETQLGDVPPVMGNAGDINQVFLNLIVNAAQAIEDSGVRESGGRGSIRICTVRDGDDVVVSISDTGCGITAEVAERVFDPFFTTKEVGRGTGQGLAIARTLVVERHAGTLTFETVPGHGTTFHVRLPIGQQSPAVEPEGPSVATFQAA